jgi:hypothetical protein
MSTRKPDPAIAAYDRVRAALKADNDAYDALDEAEAKARAAGFRVRWPSIIVGDCDCMSMASVRHHARALPQAEAAKAIEAMRTALAARKQQRRKAGLAPLDAARERARREWRSAMQGMANTRATTPKGVSLKLKLIELELRDGDTGFGRGILASAIADLSRMERRR